MKAGSVTVSHLRFGPRSIRSAYLIGRATFEPTHGPVDAVEILAAARQSRSGPSHVVGRDPRTKDTSAPRLARDEVAERRTLGEWTASRRHLRAVRPTDS